MAALECLCHLLGVNSKKFTKHENLILEAELYLRISQEIWETYRTQCKDYFNFIDHKENATMELHIIRYLINELIKSNAYTLPGIACYTQIPLEIIENIFMGLNVSNIITLPRKLVELHKFEQRDIYQHILKKLMNDKNEISKK